MGYCQRCHIGSIDEQGLCSLCGAPEHPPTGLSRLAEAGGSALSILLHPVTLGSLLLLVVLVVAGTVASGHLQPPPGGPTLGLGAIFDPRAAAAGARTDPLGTLIRLLLPALSQAFIFGLLLTGLAVLFRRRRPDRRPRRWDRLT